ncbi:hypothetical protein [Blautia sp.]|uniref:hypothetical protein n=1 Tax=Blautia sp. TaxID=1955243 RepID=UPI003A19DDC0
MGRPTQGTTTAFAEVLPSTGSTCQQNRPSGNDNRLMMYFQGVKLYIPDRVRYDTLLTTLQVLKKL